MSLQDLVWWLVHVVSAALANGSDDGTVSHVTRLSAALEAHMEFDSHSVDGLRPRLPALGAICSNSQQPNFFMTEICRRTVT